MVSKGFAMPHAKELVYSALDDFVQGYGVMYPTVGYLLGKRGGGTISNAADTDPYGMGDLRPMEDVIRELRKQRGEA